MTEQIELKKTELEKEEKDLAKLQDDFKIKFPEEDSETYFANQIRIKLEKVLELRKKINKE